jgi:hypothetical protein
MDDIISVTLLLLFFFFLGTGVNYMHGGAKFLNTGQLILNIF